MRQRTLIIFLLAVLLALAAGCIATPYYYYRIRPRLFSGTDIVRFQRPPIADIIGQAGMDILRELA